MPNGSPLSLNVNYWTVTAFSNEYVWPSGLLRLMGAAPAPSAGTTHDNVSASTKLQFALSPPIFTVLPTTNPLPRT